MLLYLGYIAIWRAFDDPHRAASLARVVALVGVINIPIVKFSVNWWNTLHQPASIVRVGGPAIDKSILWPLGLMFLAFTLLFITTHLVALKNEVRARKIRTEKLRAIGAR
jgi:heme exporter protein C